MTCTSDNICLSAPLVLSCCALLHTCSCTDVVLLTFSGGVTIPGSMTLTVDSDLNGDSPQFILTCTSTGGPATTVTWTRDSETVSGGMTVLDDPVTHSVQ